MTGGFEAHTPLIEQWNLVRHYTNLKDVTQVFGTQRRSALLSELHLRYVRQFQSAGLLRACF